ncbi:MAG TPA: hypothetical protein VMF65_13110 [Acidimicrobiales bacterium]|nr:hypothetical protein [Acidimicrobiales bacterium]
MADQARPRVNEVLDAADRSMSSGHRQSGHWEVVCLDPEVMG